MALSMTCPPCEFTLTANDEAELVALVQQHQRDEHGGASDADEIIEHFIVIA
jgi:predicted small metal-binding protein